MRIRKKAHVEYKVRVHGHSAFIAKADHRNQNVLFCTALSELCRNVAAQLVDVETGAVHDNIRHIADWLQHAALLVQSGFDRLILTERMRPAGLTEPA